MSETLEYPPITAPEPAKTVITKVDLKAVALSRFGDWKPDAEKVVAKYKGVIFDATTPKGYKSLTEAIAEVRAPRYAAQNVSKASKSELAAVSKAVGAEEAAVAAFLEATEKELVAQKDAEDVRREAEAQRLRDIETARVAGHRARIAAIRECVAKARGISAERIARGIAAVEAQVTSAESFEEFAQEADAAKWETVEAMQALHAAAAKAEADAAAAEAQRIGQARVAEEQRVERARLAEVAAEQKRAADALTAQQAEVARQMAALEAAKIAAAAPKPAEAVAEAPAAPPAVLETLAPIPPYSAPTTPLSADEPAAALPPVIGTLNAGQIAHRLGFVLTVDFIADVLHVPPATVRGRSTLWTPRQVCDICTALIAHLEKVVAAQEAVEA